MKIIDDIIIFCSLVLVAVIGILIYIANPDGYDGFKNFRWPSSPKIENTIPEQSYAYEQLLAKGPGLAAVERHCTNCHSTRLIIQNRMSRERWEDNITWMQETQGLWDLGSDHDIVIDYLATHYVPTQSGRRPNLSAESLDWYKLE